jgi:hypothetical protein
MDVPLCNPVSYATCNLMKKRGKNSALEATGC